MPGQERLRRDDPGNLLESTRSKALRLLHKQPPLIIREPQALLSLQFPEYTDLLSKVFDDVLLLSVDPTCQGNQDESADSHRGKLAE